MQNVVDVVFVFTILIVFDIFTVSAKPALVGQLVLLAQVDIDVRHRLVHVVFVELELDVMMGFEVSFVHEMVGLVFLDLDGVLFAILDVFHVYLAQGDVHYQYPEHALFHVKILYF